LGAWLIAPELAPSGAAAWVFETPGARERLAAAKEVVARPKLYVRLPTLDSRALEAELDDVMAAAPDGVVLPFCRGGVDVQRLGVKLAVREALNDLVDGSTRIVALASDARSLMDLSSYIGCSRRLYALAWDAETLAANLGVSQGASPLRTARNLVLIAARAAGVAALDTAGGDATRARADGFAGMFARDPGEAAVIAKVWA